MAAAMGVSEVPVSMALQIVNLLREVKRKSLEKEAKIADYETMAIKLKREELPRYAACIKLE